jgi:hypothetical protein
MGPLEIVAAGIVILLAGIGQSAVGFGYALFSTPLLVWLGIPLPDIIALVSTCSMAQSIIGSRRLRASVPWRWAFIASALRVASVVVGVLLLKRLVELDPAHVRMVIGAILCFLVIVQALWRPPPVAALHWRWAGLAFTASGLLAGVCGMGGPPLVLWSMAHDWPSQKVRGFLFAVFATSIPFQLIIWGFMFGPSVLRSAALGIAFLPLVYIGSLLGMPIGNRMARDRLRRIAYAILFVMGLTAILPALLQLLD